MSFRSCIGVVGGGWGNQTCYFKKQKTKELDSNYSCASAVDKPKLETTLSVLDLKKSRSSGAEGEWLR